jgi:putative ABC transport system substrate-binding protein
MLKGLLRQLVRSATSIAVLVNPVRPGVDAQVARVQEAAGTLGLHLHILKASSEGDLDAAFAMVAQLRVGALITTADGF